MKVCKCGCDSETNGGDFLPGHDLKLLTAISKAAGGIDNLRKIIENEIGEPINADNK